MFASTCLLGFSIIDVNFKMVFKRRHIQSAPATLAAFQPDNDDARSLDMLFIQEVDETNETVEAKLGTKKTLRAHSEPKGSGMMTTMRARLEVLKPEITARDFNRSAMDQALDVNELLVTILDLLPYKDLLLAQRISKKFRHVTTSTACLQRTLFKQPVAEAVIVQEASSILAHQKCILSTSSSWNSASITPNRPAILKISNHEGNLFHPFMTNIWGTGVSKYLEVGSCDPSMNIKGGCIKSRVSIPSVNVLFGLLYKPRLVPDGVSKDCAFQPAFKHLSLIWRIGPEEWVAYDGSMNGVVFSDMVRACEWDGMTCVAAKGMDLESFVDNVKTTFFMAVGRAKGVYAHDAVMGLAGLLVMHFHCW